jgi:hypothetical protein
MLGPDHQQSMTTCPVTPQAVRTAHFKGRDDFVHALRVWPRPASWFYGLRRGRWSPGAIGAAGAALADPYQPHIDDREFDLGWDADVRDLLMQIPDDVREVIRPLPRIYAWKALVLLGHVPEALDLVQEHPVLAALVGFHALDVSDASDPCRRIREHLQGGPERLLGLLDLPEDAGLVEVLDGLEPEALVDLGDEAIIEELRGSGGCGR